MSAANVELVRRIYEAWDEGISPKDFIAADVEYVNPSYAVEPGTRFGRKSGAPVEGEQGHIWTVRDDQATRFRWFGSHTEALDAAGVTDS